MEDQHSTPQNSNINTENIPHSGNKNLPDDLREQPVREFDKTSLEEAVSTGRVSEEFPADTVNDLLIDEEATEEKPWYKRTAIRIGAIALVAVAAAATVASVVLSNSNQDHSDNVPKDNGKSTSQPQASSTPEVTKTPTPVETNATNNDPLPPELASIASLSPEAISQLSAPDRLKYLSYVTRNIKQYAQEYQAETGNPIDAYPTAPLSLDSDPQAILTSEGYNLQQALLQPDKESGKRVLASALYQGNGSSAYPIWSNEIDKLPGYPATAKNIAVGNFAVSSKAESSTDVLVDPRGEKYRDITWSATYMDLYGNDQTTSGTSRYYYVEYTDYKNQPAVAWVQQ